MTAGVITSRRISMVARLLVWMLLVVGILTPCSAPAQSLDLYGGYTEIPAPGGATGFFRVEKVGNRWVLVTPKGNAFWMRAVYHATESFLDTGVIANKYGGDVSLWATQRNRRLRSWGFNALVEYTSTRGLPVGVWGRTTLNSVKLPFILLLNGALDGMGNPKAVGLPEPIKDINSGVPSTAYNGYRGPMVDLYDPKYLQAQQAEVAYWSTAITGGFASSPWVIGI